MQKPDIGLIYNENLPSDLFEDFEKSLASEGLNLEVQAKPDNGPFACAEWFIPSLIIAFIAKSYFDGFLKEAGKDHYALFKKKLSETTQKAMQIPRIEPTIFATEGKVSSNNPYSLAFSIFAEANDGKRFKLLLPKPSDSNNYTEIVNTFLDFLNDYHSGVKSLENIGFNSEHRIMAGHIFVHMNQITKQIEWLDEKLYK